MLRRGRGASRRIDVPAAAGRVVPSELCGLARAAIVGLGLGGLAFEVLKDACQGVVDAALNFEDAEHRT